MPRFAADGGRSTMHNGIQLEIARVCALIPYVRACVRACVRHCLARKNVRKTYGQKSATHTRRMQREGGGGGGQMY